MQTREANAFVPVRASEVVGCVALAMPPAR